MPNFWSGRRVSNSRPQPWQGCALPTELLPHQAQLQPKRPGGARRNRTAVNGFAIRCITTLLSRRSPRLFKRFGAGDESRTRDLNLGKVALYQLSYSRSALRRMRIVHERRPMSSAPPAGLFAMAALGNSGRGSLKISQHKIRFEINGQSVFTRIHAKNSDESYPYTKSNQTALNCNEGAGGRRRFPPMPGRTNFPAYARLPPYRNRPFLEAGSYHERDITRGVLAT